jgi:hypothetical protein
MSEADPWFAMVKVKIGSKIFYVVVSCAATPSLIDRYQFTWHAFHLRAYLTEKYRQPTYMCVAQLSFFICKASYALYTATEGSSGCDSTDDGEAGI